MSLEPIAFTLPYVAGRPVLRGADRTRWKRVFCDACSHALASGEPVDATIAMSLEATARRLAYKTWPPSGTSFDFVPPRPRTLRRWLKASATSDSQREASDRHELRRSAATTSPS